MRFSNTELMTMAIGAGDKARFLSPPNPWVGALVVSERGVVVSEGHTQVPGESHAEIEALRRAGDGARGSTMVVTLEPCSHQGRTGPCVEAIIEAGGYKMVSDQGTIVAAIEAALAANPKALEDLKGGKKKPEAVKGFLRGQVMKQTGGKADPALVGELLDAKLAELAG